MLTDAGFVGILIAYPVDFGSGELKTISVARKCKNTTNENCNYPKCYFKANLVAAQLSRTWSYHHIATDLNNMVCSIVLIRRKASTINRLKCLTCLDRQILASNCVISVTVWGPLS